MKEKPQKRSRLDQRACERSEDDHLSTAVDPETAARVGREKMQPGALRKRQRSVSSLRILVRILCALGRAVGARRKHEMRCNTNLDKITATKKCNSKRFYRRFDIINSYSFLFSSRATTASARALSPASFNSSSRRNRWTNTAAFFAWIARSRSFSITRAAA